MTTIQGKNWGKITFIFFRNFSKISILCFDFQVSTILEIGSKSQAEFQHQSVLKFWT